MSELDSQRQPPSDDEAWWYELANIYPDLFLAYLVAQALVIPGAILHFIVSGQVLAPAGLAVLWLPTIAILVRDFLRRAFSRLSWVFLWVWVAVAIGWIAYAFLVV